MAEKSLFCRGLPGLSGVGGRRRGAGRLAGTRRVGWLWVIVLLSGSRLLVAQSEASGEPRIPAVTLPLIDNQFQTHLARAEALLETQQWGEAIDNVRAVMEGLEQPLIAVPLEGAVERLGFQRYVTVREHGHRWLASLAERAPEALRLYREQVDPLAEQWFQTGLQQRDEELLARVIDELMLSHWGDDALYWAGELARQAGDWSRARGYWERIDARLRYHVSSGTAGDAYPLWMFAEMEGVPAAVAACRQLEPQSLSPAWLCYPDSDVSRARVRMGLLIVSLLEGNQRRAAYEQQLLSQLAGDESPGAIAGRRGTTSELASDLLDAADQWPQAAQRTPLRTFGGSAARNRVEPDPLQLAAEPRWKYPLPRLSKTAPGNVPLRLRVAEDHDGLLSYFPLEAGDGIVLATGPTQESILVLDAATGAVRLAPTAESRQDRGVIPNFERARGVPRLTLTAYESMLYTTAAAWGVSQRLVALDLQADNKLRYSILLTGPQWPGRWVFEGPPVADDSCLYAALRRVDQVRAAMYVACFSRRDGRLRWRRLICEAEPDPPVTGGYLSNLVSLDEGTLYYNSNMGAVAALRASDGVPRWLVTYPRELSAAVSLDSNDLHFFRDLTPPLIFQDLVIIAPRDCARIFALDANTGSLLWLTPHALGSDIVHLLGVGQETLVASGECLYWIDAYSGQLQARFPGSFHAGPGFARPEPRGYGRGLLAGNQVYWPTRESIYVFGQRTTKTDRGRKPDLVDMIDLRACDASGGNLLATDNLLLIASADQLYAFPSRGRE